MTAGTSVADAFPLETMTFWSTTAAVVEGTLFGAGACGVVFVPQDQH